MTQVWIVERGQFNGVSSVLGVFRSREAAWRKFLKESNRYEMGRPETETDGSIHADDGDHWVSLLASLPLED